MVESRVRYASRRAVLTWARAEGRPPRIQASPAEGRRNRARPLRTASPVPPVDSRAFSNLAHRLWPLLVAAVSFFFRIAGYHFA